MGKLADLFNESQLNDVIDMKSKTLSQVSCNKGVSVSCRCADLPWYKRWWNTIKGWFNSKPTNCNSKLHFIDLQVTAKSRVSCDQGVAKLCRCADLPWYKRWWNTIKGWFGSKPTNCNKKLKVIDSTPVPKYMVNFKAHKKSTNSCAKGTTKLCRCKDLAWYLRWWNTVKGWFGSKPTNCNKKLKLADLTISLQTGPKKSAPATAPAATKPAP